MQSFSIAEIRCWNHARTDGLIEFWKRQWINDRLVKDHLILYIKSGASIQSSSLFLSDSTNQNIILSLTNCSVIPWTTDCPMIINTISDDWIEIHDYRGHLLFDSNLSVGGRWMNEYSSSNHMIVYQSMMNPLKYRVILDFIDDTVCCELEGEMIIIDNNEIIRLVTTKIHCLSTALPDYCTDLILNLYKDHCTFQSIITQNIPSISPPSFLSFHEHYHSSILVSSTPTIITNISDIKQWGMAIISLHITDSLVSSPSGFTSGTHTWDILIKRCTTQYMGIGVATIGTKLNSYLGRDFTGWSFQPTGEKWHSNIGYCYGPSRPSFGEGDIISVELNLIKDTLSFYKNHTFLGIAFSGLLSEISSIENGLFPAITSYRSGDSIEILGLREGMITDEYSTDNPQKLSNWRSYWKNGMRHGFGVCEYTNGEKRYGVWCEGLCNGCVVCIVNEITTIMWYDHDICQGEATTEQIQSIITISSQLPFSSLIIHLQSLSSPPLSSIPSHSVKSTITGSLTLSSTSLFLFSSTHCAAGIELSDHQLTATCQSNSRCMLLGSRAFTTGKYYWEVRINDCDIGTMFIGVAARLPGSSHQCWRDYGFVNNRTVQDHASESLYGVQYCRGDVIGVLLDMDQGQISFVKYGTEFYYSHENTIEFGVACHHIRTGDSLTHQSLILYPSFGFKRIGDSITLIPDHSLQGPGLSAQRLIDSYTLWTSISSSLFQQQPSSTIKAITAITQRYSSLFQHDKISVLARGGIPVIIDCSSFSSLPNSISHHSHERKLIGKRYDQIWYYNWNRQYYWYFDQLERKGLRLPCESVKKDKNLRMCVEVPDWTIVFKKEWVNTIKEWVESICEKENCLLNAMTLSLIQKYTLPSSLSSSSSSSSVYYTIVLLQLIDEVAGEIMPLLDVTKLQSSLINPKSINQSLIQSSSIQSSSSILKSLITYPTKKNIFQRFLDSTATTSSHIPDDFDRPLSIPEFRVCRVAAKRSVMDGESLSSLTHHSILNQLANNLETLPLSSLRRQFNHAEDAGQKRCFFVRLVGEGVYDSGGPYREIVSSACSDEPYNVLQLVSACSNWEGGINKEEMWYIKNDELFRRVERERLLFYWGVLIGIAVRGNIAISLPLAPLFWRQLVSDEASINDLRQSDEGVINAALHLDEVTEACGGLVGVVSALPCKETTKETLLQRREEMTVQQWCSWMIECVMRDMTSSNTSVIRGIFTVIPEEICSIFTPFELQEVFCGGHSITTVDLQSITEYGDGLDISTSLIQRFWRVIQSFTDTQRSRLLEFVCARTRIPSPPSPPISFKIVVVRGGDRVLPQSQTCFSILKLPMYSSDDVMKKQLIYAMENTPTMELDVQMHDADGW